MNKVAPSKKRDVYKVYDAFLGDELTNDEFAALRKKSKLANPELLSREEIDDMKRGFTNSVRRPINMSAVESTCISGGSSNNVKLKFSDSVNATLLFEQVEGMRGKRTFVIHNFDKNTPHYTQLFTWPVFNDITEVTMQPIYYLIQRGNRQQQQQKTNNKKTPTNEHKRHILQHLLASDSINCINLVNNIEETMGCLLLKLHVREERIAFIFEWYEEPVFMFFIAFDVNASSKKPLLDMTLHRSDLFISHQVEDEEEFLDEEEGADIGMITTPRLKNKIDTTFISFYGDTLEVADMDKLKSSPMTFLSYGYVKNEID